MEEDNDEAMDTEEDRKRQTSLKKMVKMRINKKID